MHLKFCIAVVLFSSSIILAMDDKGITPEQEREAKRAAMVKAAEIMDKLLDENELKKLSQEDIEWFKQNHDALNFCLEDLPEVTKSRPMDDDALIDNIKGISGFIRLQRALEIADSLRQEQKSDTLPDSRTTPQPIDSCRWMDDVLDFF